MMTFFQVLCEALPLATLLLLVAVIAIRSAMTSARVHQCLVVAAALALMAPFLVVWLPKWRILPANEVVWIGSGLQQHWRDVSQQVAAGYDGWFCVLGWLWTLGVCWRGCQVARQLWMLRGLWQQSRPLSREINGMVKRTLATHGLWRRVQVRLGSEASQASTWGVWSPRILLPADVLSMSLSETKLILEHELGHVRRFDALANWVLQVLCVVYWFHPLSWWITRRSQLCKELACDDLLLLSGVDADRYAACLGAATLRLQSAVDVPDWVSSFTRQHPALVRLHAILDARRSRSKLTIWEVWRVSAPIGAASLIFASLGFKVAAEAQPQTNALLRASNGESSLSLWTNVLVPMAQASQEKVGADGIRRASSIINLVTHSGVDAKTVIFSPSEPRAPLKNVEDTHSDLIVRPAESIDTANEPIIDDNISQAKPAIPRNDVLRGSQIARRIMIPGETVRAPVSIGAPSAKAQPLTANQPRSISATSRETITKQTANDGIASKGVGQLQTVGPAQNFAPERTPSTLALPSEENNGHGTVPVGANRTETSNQSLRVAEEQPIRPVEQEYPEEEKEDEVIVPNIASVMGPRGLHRYVEVELPVLEGKNWKIEVSADAKVWTDSPQVIAVEARPSISEAKVEYSAMMTQSIAETPYEFLRIRREDLPSPTSGHVLQEMKKSSRPILNKTVAH